MNLIEKQEEIIQEFEVFDDWMEKYEYIIDLGKDLPKIDDNISRVTKSRPFLKFTIVINGLSTNKCAKPVSAVEATFAATFPSPCVNLVLILFLLDTRLDFFDFKLLLDDILAVLLLRTSSATCVK